MTKHSMIWALALGILLPAAAQAQQDPALVGQGAQAYAANCGRCHNARASTERTDGEWVAIVMHMRARANLPKATANAILAYLQATNLPGSGGGDAQDAQAASAPPAGSPNAVMPAQLREALVKRALEVGAKKPDRKEDSGGS